MEKRSTLNKERLLCWGAFALLFVYFWRSINIFTQIPSYSDAVEVVWGILWYNRALTESINPFHYPLMFYPEGWPVGILAHTPLLFLLSQPFYWIGGELFSYNMLAIIPFFISYAGSLRFFQHQTKSWLTAMVVSLVFTFVVMRSERALGHLHLLWATSFLPWLGQELLIWYEKEDEPFWHKQVWRCGLIWGAMISFSLYAVFLVPVIFLFLERKLLRDWRQKAGQLIIVSLIALLVGLTALLPYYSAVNGVQVESPTIYKLVYWSAGINNLFIPSGQHPAPPIRALSHQIHPPSGGESRMHNMGLSTLVFVVIGLYHFWKLPDKRYGSLLVALVGILFALGPLLKYDGHVIEVSGVAPLNEWLWGLGHTVNPTIFPDLDMPESYRHAIPLPSYLFAVFVPFWSGARVVARFVIFAFVGVLGLVATGFEAIPLRLRIFLMVFWLVEMMPLPTNSLSLSLDDVHPAHEWLMEQAAEGPTTVIDVYDRVRHGPEPLYISLQTGIPSASAIGSFRPLHYSFLEREVGLVGEQPLSELSRLLNAYQVRYVVVHQHRPTSQDAWIHLQTDSTWFTPLGCFDPPETHESPWAVPLCVAEVVPHPTITNVHPVYGFLDEEPWGMWATESQPRFNFVATAIKPHIITFEAFPHCFDGQEQSMNLVYNDEVLYAHQWSDCSPVSAQVVIPSDLISIGWNEVSFELGEAVSPAEIGIGSDPRKLAVGFSQLSIKQSEP